VKHPEPPNHHWGSGAVSGAERPIRDAQVCGTVQAERANGAMRRLTLAGVPTPAAGVPVNTTALLKLCIGERRHTRR
jgi:hypothetical protein